MRDEGIVFISYAKEDEIAVLDLAATLENAGIKVWLDKRDILAGQSWKDQIEIAIEQASLFLFCLSTKSCSKTGFVQYELRYAYEQAKLRTENEVYVIPVRLMECAPPRNLRHLQYIDFFEANGLSKLIFSIRQHLKLLPRTKVVRPASGAASGVLSSQIDPERQYLVAANLLLKQWEERYSKLITNTSYVLMCLERFELQALYLIRDYATKGKVGTFSGKLTEAGESWLRKAIVFDLIRQHARVDNEQSDFHRVVTLTLNERGLQLLKQNDTEPLATLCLPPSLSALNLFDILLANDLSWHRQISDGLIRLRKNRLWPQLLAPLIDTGLYSVEHENEGFYTLSFSSKVIDLGNIMAAIEFNKTLRPRVLLKPDEWEILNTLRSMSKSRTLPYIALDKSTVSNHRESLKRLEILELLGLKKIKQSHYAMLTHQGLMITEDASFEEENEGNSPILFESMRSINE